MRDEEYPSLYLTMDKAAVANQKTHFGLLRAEIALLLATATLGSISWTVWPSIGLYAAVALAIVLLIVIVIGLQRQLRRYDRVWFDCRVVAESAKVETWRFMMRVDPYSEGMDEATAEGKFLKQLGELLRTAPHEARSQLGGFPITGAQITQFMRNVRGWSPHERLKLYWKDRLGDQKEWYAAKARWNAHRETFWFRTSLSLQVASAAVAIVAVGFGNPVVSPVGIFTTMAAGGQSWANARSHRELSQSYGLIAQELATVEEQAAHFTTDKEVETWVLEVERTISREHTLWVARRL